MIKMIENIKYDSLYSALQALNESLTGEKIKADSTYSLIENMVDTLGGIPATYTMTRDGEDDHCPMGTLNVEGSGTYIPWEWESIVGWNEVNVNVSKDDIIAPEIEIIGWNKNVEWGGDLILEYKVIKGNVDDIDASWWEREDWEEGDIKYIRFMNITYGSEIYITGLKTYYQNCEINFPCFITLDYTLTDKPEYLSETAWEEGTWGNPDDVIVCNSLAEFMSMPDSTKENPQWYEITGQILTAPRVEELLMIITDDSVSGDEYNVWGSHNGLLLNKCAPTLADSIEGDGIDIFPGDGNIAKFKTLKFTADQRYLLRDIDKVVKQGSVFGGKFGDSPRAILIKEQE